MVQPTTAEQWEVLLLLISSEEKMFPIDKDTEVDTMLYLNDNVEIRCLLLYWINEMQTIYAKKFCNDTAQKCELLALKFRIQGNEKFKENAIEESYKLFCKSLTYAPEDHPTYGLALANRSAASLKMGKYKICLEDIELALSSNYPKEQFHKLYLRQVDCYGELGFKELAKASLIKAVNHAEYLKLKGSSAAEFYKHARMMGDKAQTKGPVPRDVHIPPPTCFRGQNNNYVSASNALELRRAENCGRFVVAQEKIQRGEVLYSEEPYAWVTLPHTNTDKISCETCCKFDVNPIPCTKCSRSFYCGVECRNRGHEMFHRWECKAVQANILPTIGIAHLALRVLLMAAYEGFPKVPLSPTAMAEPSTAADLFERYAQVDNIEIYNRNTPAFYRMFNLVTNFQKMNNADYLQYALTAEMLMLYLSESTSFFDYLPSRIPYKLSSHELRLFASSMLLRAMGQLVMNGHATLTLTTSNQDKGGLDEAAAYEARVPSLTVTELELRRATAIYPSAAMMNHSCDPNIINTFYQGRLVVVCGKEMSPGTEVTNCYGPQRCRESTADRRSALQAQYLFHCTCTACTEDNGKDFISTFNAYACQTCKGPVNCPSESLPNPTCLQCGAQFHIERALDALDRAKVLSAQADQVANPTEECENLEGAYRLQQQVLHRHHINLRDTADKLARFYADQGDFNKSMEMIKLNIQSLEYQYGSFSSEVAHELRKLSDLMLERMVSVTNKDDCREWCLETHKIIKKAVQLTELNYGAWEPLVKKLKMSEEYVASLLRGSSSDLDDSVHRMFYYNLKI